MANEIAVTVGLTFTKSGVTSTADLATTNFDMTGTDYIRRTQLVGTSEEALDVGEIGTAGWMYVKNNHATQTVSFRGGSAEADFVKLKAGESAVFRLASDTPYAIASGADTNIEYLIIED